jgi:hypothetical protein
MICINSLHCFLNFSLIRNKNVAIIHKMYLKRSRKGKRHVRRRSIRHRRRTHNRKGGGKAELEAELAQLDASWVLDSRTPQNAHLAALHDHKRRTLLDQIVIASRKEEEGIHEALEAVKKAEEDYQTSLANSARFEQERQARVAQAMYQQARDDAQMARWSGQIGPEAVIVEASHVPLATSIDEFRQRQLAYEAAARHQQALDDARMAELSRHLGTRQ